MTTQATADQLPPLPEHIAEVLVITSDTCHRFFKAAQHYYTANQMHAHASAYALTSLAAKDAEIVMLREELEILADTMDVFVKDGSAAPNSVIGKNVISARAVLSQGAKA